MTDIAESIDQHLSRAAACLDFREALRPRGVVEEVADGVALIAGLPQVAYQELLRFEGGALGMALDLRSTVTGAVLLTAGRQISTGDGVVGLGQQPEIPVGEAVLGRIFDPLGIPLDGGPQFTNADRFAMFRPAPEITERKSVDQPLLTGISLIDATIPIGRGQRELIVGDRNVGKTSLALDVVAAQKSGDVACVYVAIGQPLGRVLATRELLRQAGCLENTAFVVAEASATPGLQYLAPYAGASVAEWFRQQGRHAVIVYDDLTKHADAYRQMALLLDRPPGREAYPGDIFYVHAELLERATALRAELGGGSVTALPIVETTDNDLAAYIPTNLISITDGQIYLESSRFERDQRPAVDIGKSVSRIGSVAQPKAMRSVARNLRILISRFESLEALTRVGLDIDAATQATIRRGQLMREMLRQGRLAPRTIAEQITLLTLVNEGLLDGVSPEDARPMALAIAAQARTACTAAVNLLDRGELPASGWLEWLKTAAQQIRSQA